MSSGYSRLRLLSILCALVAVGVGFYLLIHAFAPDATIPGCGDDGCHVVLQSKWSVWFGIPVVGLGLMTYGGFIAAMLAVQFAPRVENRRIARLVIDGCSVAIALGVVYFVSIQAVSLHAYCRFCMTAHAFGLLAVFFWHFSTRGHKAAAAMEPTSNRHERDPVHSMLTRQMAAEYDDQMESASFPSRAIVIVGSCVLFAAFAIGHYYDEGPETHLVLEADDVNPASGITRDPHLVASNQIKVSGPAKTEGDEVGSPERVNPKSNTETAPLVSPISIDAAEPPRPVGPTQPQAVVRLPGDVELTLDRFPTLGGDRSKPVVVELFDYTCQSCQRMHKGLKRVLPSYSDKFVFVFIPCPLERSCHPGLSGSVKGHPGACKHAKIALAVWKVAPDHFEEYHDWVFEKKPSPENALTMANLTAGADAIEEALNDPSIEEDLEIATRLFREGGKARMPMLFLPTGRVSLGVPRSDAAMRKVLNDELLRIRLNTRRSDPFP